jgi:endonuclease/exonuclease/phosphatase family metal-dependent hydrolase
MKIVSYNLHFGGKKGDANQWQKVLAEFDPDIIFAQESFDPGEYFSLEQRADSKWRLWAPVSGVKWGSAIVTPRHELEPVELDEFAGWVTGGRISNLTIGGKSQSVMVFSVHAPSPGPYEKTVSKILDALFKRWDKTALIVGGDFNITTAKRRPKSVTPPPHNTAGEIKILERMRRELGLLNAWQVLHPNEDLPQTLRWSKDPITPYHCDGIFVSHDLVPHLLNASVEGGEPWKALSDHNPVTVTLD